MHVTARLLRRCVTSLLLALFCLPVAVIIFDTLPQRAPHRHELQVAEPRNSSWYSEAVMEARMGWRRRTLKEACSRYGLDVPGNDSLHRPNAWEFLINKKYHLIWCNVFKAASSSWMYNFNILAGYKREFLRRSNIVPLQLARKRYPRPTVKELHAALNDSLAFLIVRHPLERLLSAYRDKIQYALPNTHHAKLGQRIVLQFRNKIDKEGRPIRDRSLHNPRWPTFPEFVSYLVHEHRKGHTLDMHWTPITEFCSPCQVEFDMILKFDTLDEDQRYLIEVAGIGHLVKAEWRNPSKGPNTPDVITKYYSQLTLTQLLQLYNIYRFDFELFGFSLDRYLELAANDSPTKAILV
ncbi:carbohydrate sulfotransferase 11-like [Macrosteles quadrilineatus]|uniref:carbohydrate sulfotransferase 11-like n=1 Tax=Macrosteles quadrilineatus TaxID=74068 RepID=UPI0023E2A72C|nr:carbohydrate sulfotransferase 11-like [Macrosteles quadrilineatus]XP_054290687.1 carbohydrate sulfotransferase 11-like [Macrosteles quadrilineatus]